MQFLSRTLTPASIRNYLGGVHLLHLFTGAGYPFTNDFILTLTLRGIARNALHNHPLRALPVTPSILLTIFHVLECEGDPRASTLFCAFLFTFYLMARLANIVTKSANSFDPRRHLTRGDVAVTSHGLLATFKCTKTIQFGERRPHIPLLRIADSPLCPVSVYLRMIRLVPDCRLSPVFLISCPKGLIPLTKRTFVSSFRSYLVAAGISNAQSFRGHSFRRGAATWAFRCGVPGELIQLYGDWSSDAYKLYLEFSLDSKLALAHQLRQAILHVP